MFGREFYRLAVDILLLATFTIANADEDPCKRGFEFDATTAGTISSPFYGKRNYTTDLLCRYRIKAPAGYRIKITFKDLDIVPSRSCAYDQLLVTSKYGDEMAYICGSQLPYPILSKEGENELALMFMTDDMATAKGFLIQYESSPYFTSVCDPGFTQCVNRNCYKNDKKCDGVDDCGDGTDEEDCGKPIQTFPEKCGVQEIEPNTIYKEGADRMVGGEEAVPNSWPWQATLQQSASEPNGHFCGGTLINSQWVLTAAHCVKSMRLPGQIRIHLGAHYSYKKTRYEQIRYSKKIIAYPDLEGNAILRYSLNDDMALIKLNAPVTFNAGVQPACLPSLGWKAEPGWQCYVSGWGETRGTGGLDVLKQTDQIVQMPKNCPKLFNEDTQICVGKRKNSPCHGDSGGPLHCRVENKWYVFGATSFVTTSNLQGGICTGPGAMTVYANAAIKAEWIKAIVNKYS